MYRKFSHFWTNCLSWRWSQLCLSFFFSGIPLLLERYVLVTVKDTRLTSAAYPFLQVIYMAWAVVVLPLLASGLVYVTFVREVSVQTFEFLSVVTPITLLPILSTKSSQRESNVSPSSMAHATVLMVSSVVAFSHGAATLQFVLLLPIFACIDILCKARF